MRTDAELLTAWRGGDNNAGRILFDRHIASLSRFLRGKVDNTEREDLIQSVFVSCLGPNVVLEKSSSFTAYLFRAARNRLIDHYSARARDAQRFDPLAQSIVDVGHSPSAVVLRQQEERILLHALRRLPLDLQLMLELHYWEDLSTAALAEIFDIPQGTVKTRLWRARTQIREILDRSEHDPHLVETTVHRLADWAVSLRDLEEIPGGANPNAAQSNEKPKKI